eukprot:XP_027300412.1 uncharacterized protein LOC113839892 [Anas platyrhynchos]
MCSVRTLGIITAPPPCCTPSLGTGPGSSSQVSVAACGGAGDIPGDIPGDTGFSHSLSDASEPKVSILVPVDTEEPSDFVPLLCQLPSGWDTVRWQHGRDTPVTAMDEDELGVPGAWNLTWVSAEHWDGAMNCTATERGTGRIISETIGTAGCFLWLLAFVPPGAAVLALMWWAARLRRRPARAVLRRGPEPECEYAALGH